MTLSPTQQRVLTRLANGETMTRWFWRYTYRFENDDRAVHGGAIQKLLTLRLIRTKDTLTDCGIQTYVILTPDGERVAVDLINAMSSE